MIAPSLLLASILAAFAQAAPSQGQLVQVQGREMIVASRGAKENSTKLVCNGKDVFCEQLSFLGITLKFGSADWRRLADAALEEVSIMESKRVGLSTASLVDINVGDQYGQSWTISLYDARGVAFVAGPSRAGEVVPEKLRYFIRPNFIGYLLAVNTGHVDIVRVFPDWQAWNAEVEKRTGVKPRYNGDMPKTAIQRILDSVRSLSGS